MSPDDAPYISPGHPTHFMAIKTVKFMPHSPKKNTRNNNHWLIMSLCHKRGRVQNKILNGYIGSKLQAADQSRWYMNVSESDWMTCKKYAKNCASCKTVPSGVIWWIAF